MLRHLLFVGCLTAAFTMAQEGLNEFIGVGGENAGDRPPLPEKLEGLYGAERHGGGGAVFRFFSDGSVVYSGSTPKSPEILAYTRKEPDSWVGTVNRTDKAFTFKAQSGWIKERAIEVELKTWRKDTLIATLTWSSGRKESIPIRKIEITEEMLKAEAAAEAKDKSITRDEWEKRRQDVVAEYEKERRRVQKAEREMEPFRAQLAEAWKEATDSKQKYVLGAIIDRKYPNSDGKKPRIRLVIIHREQLDLDDYGFVAIQKDDKVEEIDTCLGESYWLKSTGEVVCDNERPRGTYLLVEWIIPSGHDVVTLQFGGIECLKIDLSKAKEEAQVKFREELEKIRKDLDSGPLTPFGEEEP
ncbi:MAG TPA: hypothetical protein VEJ63_21245 [Planctomycetota bacterium]|nr:hypothetical protein [Planctomycetota bacterium]